MPDAAEYIQQKERSVYGRHHYSARQLALVDAVETGVDLLQSMSRAQIYDTIRRDQLTGTVKRASDAYQVV